MAALCLGSLTYGYNFSVLTNTLGQPNFYAFFDLTQDPKDEAKYAYTNQIIGACNGIFSAGGFLGAILMGWWCEARGRKEALAGAAAVSILGGALSAGSANIAMFLAARTITGIGVGMFVTLVPIFQSEIAPPAARGFLVGQHGFILVTGYAIAGWVGYGTFFAEIPPFQWRFPLALQVLWPLALVCVLPWIPESPRWCKSAMLNSMLRAQVLTFVQCWIVTETQKPGRSSANFTCGRETRTRLLPEQSSTKLLSSQNPTG